MTHNKSLDASGGSVFRNLYGAAKLALIRAAASTQPLDASPIARFWEVMMSKLIFAMMLSAALTVNCGTPSSGVTSPIATSSSHFPVGTAPGSVEIADLNNDGKPDIVVANEQSNNVTILLGDGKGGFTQAKGFPRLTTPLPAQSQVTNGNVVRIVPGGKRGGGKPNNHRQPDLNREVLAGDLQSLSARPVLALPRKLPSRPSQPLLGGHYARAFSA